ncbi:MAG: flagellar basal body P-ring formation chaperone FlgA [Acidobacteriota bacterium]|nr:flagellar basal body P-ring formation chaperone FlgA [Acidobacteriota bacterium]
MRYSTFACLTLAYTGAALAPSACLPVQGSRILGRDMAAADARFQGLPATLALGFAPSPGTNRVFGLPELGRIARANGIAAEGLTGICFELPMRALNPEDVAAAMRRVLPADAVLRIVEMPVRDVPAGSIDFPLSALEPPLDSNHGVQLWRGEVTYAETRRVSLWARVEVTLHYKAVVAVRDLPAGTPINADSLRLETKAGPLPPEKVAVRIEDVEGRIPGRALKAGAAVLLTLLSNGPKVRRGDAVTVEVESGPARLRFEAVAEKAARDGDTVELRNPLTGKTFRAKLSSDGRAVIVIGRGRRL